MQGCQIAKRQESETKKHGLFSLTTWSIAWMERINGGKKYNIDISYTKDSGLHDFREVIAFRCDACVAAMLLARTAYYYPKTSITCRWSAWSDVSNPDLSGLYVK